MKPKRETAERVCRCGDPECRVKAERDKKRRETAEQRARRIGRGLGFTVWEYTNGWYVRDGECLPIREATAAEVTLWRALERSQRALARARGIKP